MEKDVQKLIDAGQQEDSVIVHAAPGEMVVPPVISEQTQQMINQDMQSVGLNPAEYMIGQGSVNNLTGLQEFGFLSKLFKKVKKVAKKVLPVAAAFIPGGPLLKAGLTTVAGKASGMDTKDALLGGLTAGLGAKFLGSGTTGKGLSGLKGTSGKFFGKQGTFRNILGRGKEFILPGEDKKGLFKNIFGLGQQTGMPEMEYDAAGNPTGMYVDSVTGDKYTFGQLKDMGLIDRSGNLVGSPLSKLDSGPKFSGITGPGSFADKILNIDPNKGTGPLSFLQGSGGQKLYDADGKLVSSKGLGLGGAGGIAGLAALFGLATKKAAEKTEGGLRDVRLSTRPDLLPQATFQGFDVGVRPGMFYGGRMDEQELDMRMGGPSVGPGTETSDDIPAMLSDGEFVMTAAANKGLGGFKIEKNKDSLTIFPTGKPDREQGFKNNDKLMKFFEGYQDMMS
jgi:hypothetical protein